MIYLTGSIGGEKRKEVFAQNENLGFLVSPLAWRSPWCRYYACDNDVFGAWTRYTKQPNDFPRPDDWWRGGGESRWLAMLDKLVGFHEPLFVLLPDRVADCRVTMGLAAYYRKEVEVRGLKTGLALQDGCDFREVESFKPDALFIGGSTRWKWENAERIIKTYRGEFWIHVGRVNGPTRIRAVKDWGAHSADGTRLSRHFDSELPRVLDGLNNIPDQLSFF